MESKDLEQTDLEQKKTREKAEAFFLIITLFALSLWILYGIGNMFIN